MIRVIINGMEMDTFAGTDIAQTKQTNDITSIETKQTNYTNAFDLPKTPKNVENMQYLSLVGNTSDVPYQKNECYLYDQKTGECFVWKGWAIIKESTDVYKCHVYDGNLDLYKTIENFILKDLDLTELEHAKDLEIVIASWTNPVYRYILADYGGKTSFGAPEKINIDYLTPSVRVKWLWDRLFQYFNITYSGSVFQTEDFDNLWMTYPKGLNTGEGDILVLESADYDYEMQVVRRLPVPPFQPIEAAYYPKALTWDEGPKYFLYRQGIHMQVYESGIYRLDITGTIVTQYSGHPDATVLVGRNTEGILPNNVTPIGSNIAFVPIGEAFSKSFIFDLNAFDTASVVIKGKPGGIFVLDKEESDLSMSFTKVNPVVIDFGEAFIDFSATDFVKEVMAEFGLSLFKDKYKDHYEFLTMDERLQTSEVEDWSHKYQSKISESYIYGSYAQLNILKHKYNEENASYNDGSVTIDNVNLPDQKTLFQSKLHSPERLTVNYFGRDTLVYKAFDKEIKDNGEVKYKSLDKRFYFMRSTPYAFPNGTAIGSEQLGTEQAIVGDAQVEAYGRIAYRDVVTNRYRAILNVLNKSQLLKVLMNFSAMDIANIDFRKLYHISRNDINGYFMLNKINGYRPGQKTVTELVRVIPNSQNIPAPRISFGNGIDKLTVKVGQTVDIWLNNYYGEITDISEKKAVRVSPYHYRFTPDVSKLYNISMVVDMKGAETNTNTITLNVNP